ASPPHLPAARWQDVPRRQRSVLRGVPFAGDPSVPRCQRRLRRGPLSSTEGAANALVGTGEGGPLPDMRRALGAPPPYLALGPWVHVPRGQRRILRGVPFAGEARVQRGERGLLGRAQPRAERAATPQVSARVGGRLPLVRWVLRAPPRDAL